MLLMFHCFVCIFVLCFMLSLPRKYKYTLPDTFICIFYLNYPKKKLAVAGRGRLMFRWPWPSEMLGFWPWLAVAVPQNDLAAQHYFRHIFPEISDIH